MSVSVGSGCKITARARCPHCRKGVAEICVPIDGANWWCVGCKVLLRDGDVRFI